MYIKLRYKYKSVHSNETESGIFLLLKSEDEMDAVQHLAGIIEASKNTGELLLEVHDGFLDVPELESEDGL